MDYEAIRTEVTTGELATAISGKPRNEALAILNKQDRLGPGPIPVNSLLQWSALNGSLAKIHDASNDLSSPVRSICLALLMRMNDPTGVIALDDKNIAMIAAFVRVGILTPAQAGELSNMSPVSYAEQKFGRFLTDDDLLRIGV